MGEILCVRNQFEIFGMQWRNSRKTVLNIDGVNLTLIFGIFGARNCSKTDNFKSILDPSSADIFNRRNTSMVLLGAEDDYPGDRPIGCS